MRVLIADDDPTLRRLMRELLHGEWNCEMVEAEDGAQAWEKLDAGLAADLCIVDVCMPKLNGLDFLKKLRSDARFKQQKVILCSAVHKRETVLQAAALGVSSYLLKPFQTDEFLDRTRKICVEPTAATPQSPEPFESVGKALGRLGIGLDLYLELIGIFTADVAKLIEALKATPDLARPEDIELKLIAVGGAGRCLGSGPLVELVGRLERAVQARDAVAIANTLPLMEAENARAIAAAAQIAQEKFSR
jgi:two-component system chemotaxis response regulator CheY